VGFEPRNRQLAFDSVEQNSRIAHAGLNGSRIQALRGRFDQWVAPSDPAELKSSKIDQIKCSDFLPAWRHVELKRPNLPENRPQIDGELGLGSIGVSSTAREIFLEW
jgi:hypothetical protein